MSKESRTKRKKPDWARVLKRRHILDIYTALEIAWCDTAQPSTKRSYTAALKALRRLEDQMRKPS